jgi:glycosyltransferase involved in cell wall biosynthesis
MRIAYVNFILTKRLVGVEKKVNEQASCSPNDFDFFLLNRFVDGTNGRVNLVKIDNGRNYYDYLFKKFDIIRKSTDFSEYDLVILRYPLADRSYREFVNKYNVISEHHSEEIPELRSNITGHSLIHLKIASFVRLVLEYKYGRNYRSKCKGIICVTDELRIREAATSKAEIPSITIPNGIDVEAVTRTGFKRLDGRNLDLIFVASRFSPWDGLERVIASIKNYPGPLTIRLHIVGDIKPSDTRTAHGNNIIYHGIKRGVELDQVFSKANMAVSTMGLYLKKLRQAASLKTREYTARGIPFVLAYDDVDLGQVEEDKRFFQKLPNRREPIQVENVIEFVKDINKKFAKSSELSQYMRQYALENMDWRPKMKKYLEFCKEIKGA